MHTAFQESGEPVESARFIAAKFDAGGAAPPVIVSVEPVLEKPRRTFVMKQPRKGVIRAERDRLAGELLPLRVDNDNLRDLLRQRTAGFAVALVLVFVVGAAVGAWVL